MALKHTVDHKYVTDLLQRRFPEYEIYTGKEGECVDLIDISRVNSAAVCNAFGLPASFNLTEKRQTCCICRAPFVID